MVYEQISKVNATDIFVEDVEDQWYNMRGTKMNRVLFSEGVTFNNVHIDAVAGAPKTTGTIGPITVTNDKTFGFYKVMLVGTGDTSSCTMTTNRTTEPTTVEVGEWFYLDEATFDYTIILGGTVSIREVHIIGFRYGDGTLQYVTLS
jgi:hypothetical protein|tara:strand:- start:680 stop:1120 length:441 start_codon:yes stop_codon:yes gene_type:complete